MISYSSLLHQVLVNHVGNGFHHSLPESETSFLSGIKQRLLSFIFRGIWNEETDQTMVSKRILISLCVKSYSVLFACLLMSFITSSKLQIIDYSDWSLRLFYLSLWCYLILILTSYILRHTTSGFMFAFLGGFSFLDENLFGSSDKVESNYNCNHHSFRILH